jgi:hypothetical protein
MSTGFCQVGFTSRKERRTAMHSHISRRDLLKSAGGTTVVSAVGISGLLSLLANRQAVAAGHVIAIVGMTGEFGQRQSGAQNPAHRHTFAANFTLKSINPDTGVLLGDIFGTTGQVVSTGHDQEDFHVHPIQMSNVIIEQTIDTIVADMHFHTLHVD